MSERSSRPNGSTRAGRIVVAGAVACLLTLPATGDAFAATAVNPAAQKTVPPGQEKKTSTSTSTTLPTSTTDASTTAPAPTTSEPAPTTSEPAPTTSEPTIEPTIEPTSDDSTPRVRTIVISGTVTEAGTGAALSGVCVAPFRWYDGGDCAGTGLTDEQGRYKRTLTVPEFAGVEGRLWAQPTEGDPYHLEVATPLTLTDASEYRADIAVPRAGVLTGRVANRNGQPLQGICPQARGLDPEVWIGTPTPTCSDEAGMWSLSRVPVTEIAVALMGDATYQAAYAPSGSLLSKATLWTAVAGTTTRISDTKLIPGGTVVVKTSETGRGTNTVVLHPITTSQDLRIDPIVSTEFPDDLSPVLTNVQGGTYRVEVRNSWDNLDCTDDDTVCSSFATWWAPGTFDPGAAKPVKVVAGTQTTLGAVMQRYRKMYLKLNKLNRSQVDIQIYLASGEEWDSDDLEHLPPGKVKVKVSVDKDGKKKQWRVGGGTAIGNAAEIDTDSGTIEITDPDGDTDTTTSTTTSTKTSKTKTKTKTKTININVSKVKAATTTTRTRTKTKTKTT